MNRVVGAVASGRILFRPPEQGDRPKENPVERENGRASQPATQTGKLAHMQANTQEKEAIESLLARETPSVLSRSHELRVSWFQAGLTISIVNPAEAGNAARRLVN